MNIGFDAYYLSNRNNTGIGNVVLQIIRGLAKIDKKNRYVLFTPGVVHKDIVSEIVKNKNFTIVTVGGVFSSSRRLWLQMPALRRAVIHADIQFFFGGGEYVPILLPKNIKTGVIIHDVVFRLAPAAVPLGSSLLYKIIFPLSLRRADYVFTISNNSLIDIENFYSISKKEVFVVPNGIDLGRYNPGEKPAENRYILFVGTLQPRKNLINLLKAFVLVSDLIDERLVIVGAPGWKQSHIAQYLETVPHEVLARIEFKGYLAAADLSELYRGADLFAAPSLHEGFGLIILEAMASGTPVLTSPVGAVPEYFSGYAEFANPLSPDDIGHKIVKLLMDKKKRKAMIKKGLALSERFSVEKMSVGYLEAFNKISEGKKR